MLNVQVTIEYQMDLREDCMLHVQVVIEYQMDLREDYATCTGDDRILDRLKGELYTACTGGDRLLGCKV